MKGERDVILFRIDRKVGLLLLGALAVVFGGFALAEQLSLTTSYPVPSGIYNQLVTTGNAGAVPADTTFNRNAGNTILVPATNAGGKVGIGTSAPQAKLDVAGVVGIGAFGADPVGGDGQIYYNNGATPGFKGHVNGAWGPLAGVGGAVAAQTKIHAAGGCSPAFTFTPPAAGKYVILASASVYAWEDRCSTRVMITQGACNVANVISNQVEGYRDDGGDDKGFYFPATVIGVANLPTTTPYNFYVYLTNGGSGGSCANQFSPAAYSSVGWAAFPSL